MPIPPIATNGLFVLAFLGASLAPSASALAQPERSSAEALRVLAGGANRAASGGMLRDHLRKESHILLNRRLERFELLKTADAIVSYQKELRARFIDSLGGFPERTPLNPRVIGRLAGSGFVVEKILFESQPGFFVTGLLYLPASGAAPHPVVLMPCGHSESGKAAYQLPAMTLAKNGLAVFCYDPIGQGERKQILTDDTTGATSRPSGRFPSTSEHMLDGVAPIALGRSLATYMIWDGIRAIDYLATRTDIDIKRLGCAGVSGGGLLTSYLMALDERIVCAAPGCFITTSRRKNESPGPGDAEQNLHAQYAYGLDHADFLILHAPRPALILAATRDFVPIAGTWEAFREAKRVYARLGYAERVDLIETDAEHAYSVQLREATVRWMGRWLLHKDDAVFEEPAAVFRDAELECTPRGQVLLMAGARSVFDLNREEAARIAPSRKTKWSLLADQGRRQLVRETASIRPLDQLPAPRFENLGSVSRSGYRIEKLRLTPEKGIALPALRFVPEKGSGKACLYLHGRGKQIDAEPGGPIERTVRDGTEVLAVDMCGFGETAMTPWRYENIAQYCGANTPEYFVAYMLGRSLAGMRAEEVLMSAKVLASLAGSPARRVELVALEEAAIPALHAAALEPGLFSSIRLARLIDSWERVLEAPVTRGQLEGLIHGALRFYDLPDLVALAGKVTLTEPIDATGAAVRR